MSSQYGCPVEQPSPSNPNPEQSPVNGQLRHRRKQHDSYITSVQKLTYPSSTRELFHPMVGSCRRKLPLHWVKLSIPRQFTSHRRRSHLSFYLYPDLIPPFRSLTVRISLVVAPVAAAAMLPQRVLPRHLTCHSTVMVHLQPFRLEHGPQSYLGSLVL